MVYIHSERDLLPLLRHSSQGRGLAQSIADVCRVVVATRLVSFRVAQPVVSKTLPQRTELHGADLGRPVSLLPHTAQDIRPHHWRHLSAREPELQQRHRAVPVPRRRPRPALPQRAQDHHAPILQAEPAPGVLCRRQGRPVARCQRQPLLSLPAHQRDSQRLHAAAGPHAPQRNLPQPLAHGWSHHGLRTHARPPESRQVRGP
mmetsp:Transcript_42294/g.134360  ORF Transcript_42294/g.134360 Transcript_42294/m.134360 type:complete len:203 (+) Transcript_42294:830-1438(+)